MIMRARPTTDRAFTSRVIALQAAFLVVARMEVPLLHFQGRQQPWGYATACITARRQLCRGRYGVRAQFGHGKPKRRIPLRPGKPRPAGGPLGAAADRAGWRSCREIARRAGVLRFGAGRAPVLLPLSCQTGISVSLSPGAPEQLSTDRCVRMDLGQPPVALACLAISSLVIRPSRPEGLPMDSESRGLCLLLPPRRPALPAQLPGEGHA
jgi:hypothetical protein